MKSQVLMRERLIYEANKHLMQQTVDDEMVILKMVGNSPTTSVQRISQ